MLSPLVRPVLGLALVAGALSPFVLSTRSSPADTDAITEIHGESMVSYKVAAATLVQDAWPQPIQRGVQLDGMLRMPPSQQIAIAGNPFEDEWRAPSIGGIELSTGVYAVQDVDIALPAEGFSWVIGREHNANQIDSTPAQRDSASYQGTNWFQTSQPEIRFYDDATNSKDLVYLIYGADRYAEYKRVTNNAVSFKGTNGAAGVFEFTDGGGGADTYKLTDQNGNELTFFGFDNDAGVAKGQLWTVVDTDGNKAYVGHATTASTAISNGYDAAGRILYAYDTSDRRFTYTYSTLDGVKRLTQVKAETKTGGTWDSSPTGVTTAAQVDYAYYTSESYGDPGDLKTVTLTTPLTDSGVSLTQKKYYRYWEGGYDVSSNPGYSHAIKYIVDFEGVRRFDWQDTTFDDDHLAANDATIEPYATAYFEYDSSHRIREAWFNGECGCSGANNGTFEFEFESNGSFSDTSNTYDTTWKTRTVVKRPDLSYMTQYWDEVGQPLSQVITDVDPDNTGPDPSRWVTAVTRGSTGRVTSIATPANCTGYTHSTGAITGSTTVGLVWEFMRETASNARKGFVLAKKWKVGSSGTAYYDKEFVWTQTSKSIQGGEAHVVRPAWDAAYRYPVQTSSTSSTYSADHTPGWDGTKTLAMTSVQVADPAITTGNNGSNSAISRTQYFRLDGTPSYQKAGDGILTYHAYTNGLMTTSIQDADTSILSDEPGGLSSTGTPLHLTTTYAYDAQGRVDVVTHPDGQKTKRYYSKLADGRLVELVYADFETTPKFYGPVTYTVTNQAGNVEAQATVALTSNESTTALTGQVDESDADAITAMDLGTIRRLTTQIYNESGHTVEESRLYTIIPASGAGSDGTNYDATLFAYDDSGRRIRTKAPHGTITRTVYDDIGRVESRWTGTNDDLEGGTDDIVQVELIEYDGGADDGNGYVTERTLFVQDNSTGQRVTSYAHDARGRVLLQTNPTAPHALHKYNNEGRAVATGLFSSTGSIVVGTDDPTTETANRLALTEFSFDEVGQLWKSVRHKIDASDGSDDDTLEHLYWRDAEGRVIKEDGPQLFKVTFDPLGRETNRFILAQLSDSTYADADDVTGDHVLEEHQTVYDVDNNDVLMTVRIDREHSSWNLFPVPTGTLDSNADNDRLLVTAANVAGRPQITAMWYDRFGRQTDVVQYGNYNDANFDRDGLSVPSRSDTELVTSYAYETDGTLLTVTDPRALVKKTVYDDGGRLVTEIGNYNSGVNSGNPANPDDNQTVRYAYVDGLRTSITADMPSGESDQVTTYIYGTTKGTPSASKVASGHLLRAVAYPDSTNAGTTNSAINSDSSDVVSYAYNAQGQVVYQKDQAGNVFEMEFDDSSRELHKRVTTLAGGFDGAVRRVTRTYDGLGRPSLVTQYDNATVGSGSVTDEVSYTYDGWGGTTSFKQDKDSAVGGSGYYEMAYAYAKNTGGRNTIRRSSMTLPGSKTITLDYTADFDGPASRVSRLKDGGTTLARYEYLGQARVVGTTYNQPGISSKVYDASDDFDGYLDRFNRILESRWTTEIASPVNFYEADITYDRNSNITWVEDQVHAGFDVKYTMDDLDRLIDAEEGTRSGGSITSRTRHQTWLQSGMSQLSHTGNWARSKLDLDGDDNWNETNEYDDTRTHNAVNELTARDTDSNSSNNYTLTYDGAGNLTNDGESYEYEYDAFNRLRRIKNQSSTLLAEYRYNGLGFMIGVHEDTDADGDADGSDKWFYPAYDEGWREVARFRESDTSPMEQFVNATAGLDGRGRSSYINDVVCRNRDANTAWTSASDGVLEERYFYCPNWRGDVSALVTSGRQLHECGKYSAYGVPNSRPGADTDSDGDCDPADATQVQAWIDAPAYDVRGDVDLDGDIDATDKASAQGVPLTGTSLGWYKLSGSEVRSLRGLAGCSQESAESPFSARARKFIAALGYWCQRDKPGSRDGTNLYSYVRLNPLARLDPSGSDSITCPGAEFGSYSSIDHVQSVFNPCPELAQAGRTLCIQGLTGTCTPPCRPVISTQTEAHCAFVEAMDEWIAVIDVTCTKFCAPPYQPPESTPPTPTRPGGDHPPEGPGLPIPPGIPVRPDA